MEDGYEESFEVTAAFRFQIILQGHIIFLEIQVLDGPQVNLRLGATIISTITTKQNSNTVRWGVTIPRSGRRWCGWGCPRLCPPPSWQRSDVERRTAAGSWHTSLFGFPKSEGGQWGDHWGGSVKGLISGLVQRSVSVSVGGVNEGEAVRGVNLQITTQH